MNEYGIEVLRAAREHGIDVLPVPEAEAQEVRERLRRHYPAWFSVGWYPFPCSVQSEQGWLWISDYVGSESCLLLFHWSDEKTIFRCKSGSDLREIIGQTYHFEFFVAGIDLTFLFGFSDHSVLGADGDAAGWLRTRVERGM